MYGSTYKDLNVIVDGNSLMGINHEVFSEVVETYPEVTDEREFFTLCVITALLQDVPVMQNGKYKDLKL